MYVKPKLKILSGKTPVEGFEKIPAWVCTNLVNFGNCNVHEDTFNEFGGKEALERWGAKVRIKDIGRNKIIEVIK